MLLRSFGIAAVLAFAAPALASEDGGHATEQHADAHGADHGDSHGGGHGHENHYVGDDDGDGTANWLDGDSEHYALGGVGKHAFNLLVLFGAIFVFARKPIGDMLVRRAQGIRGEIDEATRLRDEAEARHAEVSARLTELSAEIARMEEQGKAAAAHEEQQLIERAEAEAERIRASASRTIQDESARAVRALRAEAVDLAVELARQTLTNQVTDNDRKRLAQEFLEQVGQEA